MHIGCSVGIVMEVARTRAEQYLNQKPAANSKGDNTTSSAGSTISSDSSIALRAQGDVIRVEFHRLVREGHLRNCLVSPLTRFFSAPFSFSLVIKHKQERRIKRTPFRSPSRPCSRSLILFISSTNLIKSDGALLFRFGHQQFL